MRDRRILPASLLLVLAIIGAVVFLVSPGPEPEPAAPPRPSAAEARGVAPEPSTSSKPADPENAAPPKRVRTHARADAQRVRAGLAKLAEADDARGTASARGPSRDGAEPPTKVDETDGPGQLTDRIGLDPAAVEALSAEFLPLTNECIEQARERDPELVGLLAVEVDMAGDPELGAVIDDVRFPDARNEVRDPELQTCIRETALSMLLPSPEQGGQERLMLTVPIESEQAPTKNQTKNQ
ncbi:hypothetical protein PPSIR1_26503 [Plesiocystis pacifica SIR-1]|uniref:Uncharacterized protein n=1 Tax=Plesiocystis pacifica SIR-1 TaxID=391625 RepID=A6GA11_9BACT|nr:hypothetical protein [Plesiocystis pacifica]EDM77336.1 hypothetical protein PPSIR1_26503 [Plesiocystis pacifica SIR-1]